jgi:ParB family transcriptional regulator, chromosome partitioning protein
MSAIPEVALGLQDLPTAQIVPNANNPRLDFPQNELNRLAESIANEGILVPIVVYQQDGKYVLVDGERRFRCARELGLQTVPALVTTRRTDDQILLQMFNIHQIREPWRDIPTAKALSQLVDFKRNETGRDPTDAELRDLTGLSIERVRQLRYIVELPEAWQTYIREGTIPLNFFWELKVNVVEPIATLRPNLFTEIGKDKIMISLVDKRLRRIITDSVSLRDVRPIIRYAAEDAAASDDNVSHLDDAIRELILNPDTTIEDVYEDTVASMVKMDKIERRSASMAAAFRRLMFEASNDDERMQIQKIAQKLIDELRRLFNRKNTEI